MNFEKTIEANFQFVNINLDDDFARVIDKINKNFRELQISIANRLVGTAPRGKMGLSGGRGPAGATDESYRALLKFSNPVGSTERLLSDKEILISNRRTDISLQLTDIHGESFSEIDTFNEDSKFTSDYASENFRDYKFKILAGNSISRKGRHIHLANSTNVKKSKEFLRKSGFVINIDANRDNNTEEFRVEFQKNIKIDSHAGTYKFVGDSLSIANNESFQDFTIKVESEPDSEKNGIFELNVAKTPGTVIVNTVPYSGYMALWNDFELNNHENFVQVNSENLNISHVRYSESTVNSTTTILDAYYTNQIFVRLRDDSYVRYKRLGTYWFIEYYLIVSKMQSAPVNFNVYNFRVDIQKSAGSCQSTCNFFTVPMSTSIDLNDFFVNPNLSSPRGNAAVNVKPNGFNFYNDSFLLNISNIEMPYDYTYNSDINDIFYSGVITAQNIERTDVDQTSLPLEILPFEYVE